MPTFHSSGYSFVSRISLKKITKKGKMIGALALIISLFIESSPLALLFLSFFIPFEISSAVNCEIYTLWLSFIKSRLGIGSGFFTSIFFDSKILEKCSTHLFGKIAFKVSNFSIPLSDFRCDQNCFGLSTRDSNLFM